MDFHEGASADEEAFKTLIGAAIKLNSGRAKT
jgi:hypothetical protein